MNRLFKFSARTVATCYVIFSLLALAAFATPLWYAWQEFVEQDWRHILHADSDRLQRVFDEEGVDALSRRIESRVGAIPGGSEDIVLLTDEKMQHLAGNLDAWPVEVSPIASSGRFQVDINGNRTRILARHLVLNGRFHLLVAHDINRYRLLENMFIVGLAASGTIIILLGIAGGVAIRRSLLAKVKDINQAASAIMQGDFSHRLPHHGGENELATLVQTENLMLAQIEQLMNGIINASNSIAHDLRTPLAELRSRLEGLLRVQRGDADEIEGAIEDVDRVIAIFNALLRLVEIDTGARKAGFTTVDVAAVVADIADFYQPLAESLGKFIDHRPSGPVLLRGDSLLLAQAVSNLIDNAMKFVPVGGTVTLSCVQVDEGRVLVRVSDDGPGISDAELPKVQQRFYRGDTSRATPGVGLGLSLVASVARLHDGSLELSNNHPGLRAVLILRTASVSE
ncbi:HAMP domain-containing protein [Herbaspirillum huttiense]|uniref:HAMP domain-containing sensor histidine kinase n=1 Tax=Herbaspirillum TaxID=963 RepID=UPI0010666A4F|nr:MULTISPECIES: ATP-binding protein [Herbaspirillum]MCI1016752.1 HAMP domain-containing protein [Herbaspirillum sp. C7C2]QBP73594.1 HAMP domain-containing protein [Herbaspirillum huttiense]